MNGTPSVIGILLIDDNADWSQTAQQMIEDGVPHSHRKVTWEATLTKAVAALKTFHADSIWLDLDLPDSRPDKTIEFIPELIRISGTKNIIVFSEHFAQNPHRDELVTLCMKAGAFRCATKDPASVDCLIKGLAFRALRIIYGKDDGNAG